MRTSRFAEEQIIAILAEQERGVPTADVCRKSEQAPQEDPEACNKIKLAARLSAP